MSEEKKKKVTKPITEVKLRSYPKIIFFWPLLLISLTFWIIQGVYSAGGGEDLKVLGYIWMIVLFCNLFVIAFDFSSTKFFVLFLAIAVFVILFIFLVLPYIYIPPVAEWEFTFQISWQFYMGFTLIVAFILFFVWFGAQFDYYKIERNEIYHKSGIFSAAERFPVKSLRLKKEIPDVFEFFVLRAGSITLMPGRVEEIITLHTVLNVNKKAEQIDYLLSHISVEPDEID